MKNNWVILNNDLKNYLDFCKIASNEQIVFDTFKKNVDYKVILEHISYEIGMAMKNEIKNKEIALEYIDKFKKNDIYGSPELMDYQEYGRVSPSTIRYIKNCMDIYSHINSKKMKRVVEIGGGYGGLALLMLQLFDIEEYIIIDEPNVIMLVEKYISNFPEIKNKIKTYSCYEYDDIKDVNLVISNYALSELNIDSQKNYCEKIIKNSEYFYVIYNFIYDNPMERFDYFKEFINLYFSYTIEQDTEPKTNLILYGKRKGFN